MGYRSEVKAVFYAPQAKWAALKLYVDENFPTIGDLMRDEDLKAFEGLGYCGYLFGQDDVKWYPNYAEVIAFNEFVHAFLELAEGDNAEALDWNYEFVRIGENYEDIETVYSDDCAYLLNVRREIEVNFSLKEGA
jgi:hypothetical protein